jgi:hypothetical protein
MRLLEETTMASTMAMDVTEFDKAFKAVYIDPELHDLTYTDNPFYGILKKNSGFGGDETPIPVKYSGSHGRSANFVNAQANVKATAIEAFKLNQSRLADNFGVATWSDKVVTASRGKAMAFVEAHKEEIDSILQTMAQDIEFSLLGNGSGKRGTISTVSTTRITLTPTKDAENFEVGMTIGTADDESTAANSGNGLISAVDRDNGYLDCASNWNAAGNIPDIANSDVVFVDGDYSSASDRNKIKGLEGWIPATAPTAGDSWFGVDRSKDVCRLAGNRLDASSDYPLKEEALKKAQMVCSSRTGRPDLALVSYNNYDEITSNLQNKMRYVQLFAKDAAGKKLKIPFEAVQFDGPKGPMTVLPLRHLADSVSWVLQLNTWELWSMEACIHFMNKDGMMFCRQYDNVGYEVRALSYAQLICKHPGANCRVKHS